MTNHNDLDLTLSTMRCELCEKKNETSQMYFIQSDHTSLLTFSVNRKKPSLGEKVCCENFARLLEFKAAEMMGSYRILDSTKL